MPDIYDRGDLGVLRRRIRKAGETFLRDRELYLGTVHRFLEVMPPCCSPWLCMCRPGHAPGTSPALPSSCCWLSSSTLGWCVHHRQVLRRWRT